MGAQHSAQHRGGRVRLRRRAATMGITTSSELQNAGVDIEHAVRIVEAQLAAEKAKLQAGANSDTQAAAVAVVAAAVAAARGGSPHGARSPGQAPGTPPRPLHPSAAALQVEMPPWEVVASLGEGEWFAFRSWIESGWRCRKCGHVRDDHGDHPKAVRLLCACGIPVPGHRGPVAPVSNPRPFSPSTSFRSGTSQGVVGYASQSPDHPVGYLSEQSSRSAASSRGSSPLHAALGVGIGAGGGRSRSQCESPRFAGDHEGTKLSFPERAGELEERLVLQRQLDVVEEQLAEVARGTQKRLEDLEALERSWMEERAALEQRVQELEVEAAQGAQAWEEAVALRQRVGEVQALWQGEAGERERLRGRLVEVEEQLEKAERAALAAVRALQAELEASKLARAKLEQQVEAAEREAEEANGEKEDLWLRIQELEEETRAREQTHGEAISSGHSAASAPAQAPNADRELESAVQQLEAARAAVVAAETLCKSSQRHEQELKEKLEAAGREVQRAAGDTSLAREQASRTQEGQLALRRSLEHLREKAAVAHARADVAKQEVVRAKALVVGRVWRLRVMQRRMGRSEELRMQGGKHPASRGQEEQQGSDGAMLGKSGSTTTKGRQGVGKDMEVQVAALGRRLDEAQAHEQALRRQLAAAQQNEALLSVRSSCLASDLAAAKQELEAAREAERDLHRRMLVLHRIKEALEGEVRKWREEAKMRRKAEEESMAALGMLGSRTASSSSLNPGVAGGEPRPARRVNTTGGDDIKISASDEGPVFSRPRSDSGGGRRAQTPDRVVGVSRTSSRSSTPERPTRSGGGLKLKSPASGSFVRTNATVEDNLSESGSRQSGPFHRTKTAASNRILESPEKAQRAHGSAATEPSQKRSHHQHDFASGSSSSSRERKQDTKQSTQSSGSGSLARGPSTTGISVSAMEAVRFGRLRKFRSAFFGRQGHSDGI